MIDFSQAKATLRWQFLFEGSWPSAVAFVDGGKRLAAGNQDGQIFIWDLAAADAAPAESSGAQNKKAPSLSPQRLLVGHTNGVSRLQVSPDGGTLFSASLDHTIHVWDLHAPADGQAEVVLDRDTREQQARRSGKQTPPDAPGVSVETQHAQAVLEGHNDWIEAMAISRDGTRLLSGDSVSQIIVWDVAERKEIARWSGRPWNGIVALALTADGKTALVSEHRHKRDDFDVPSAAVRLWDVVEKKEKIDILKVQFPKYNPESSTYEASQIWRKFVGSGLIAADFSHDGELLALAQGGETSEPGKVHVLEAATGKLLRDVSGHANGVTDTRFSSDGSYLLSTGRDTLLRICRVADGKEVAQLGFPRGGQTKDLLPAFAVSPDDRWIAATDIAGLVHVWSI